VSVVQCGLILFLFVFAAHFRLSWRRPVFGITLGFGIAASVHLAYWGLMADWLFGQKSYFLDFSLWRPTKSRADLVYYLLVPRRMPLRLRFSCLRIISTSGTGNWSVTSTMSLAIILVIAAVVALGMILRLLCPEACS